MLPRASLLAALVLAPVTALAVSGCGGSEPAPTADPAEGRPPAGASAAASATPPTASASTSPTTEPRRKRTLVPIESATPLARPSRSHLLPADRLPRLARDLTWARTTDDAGGEPVGACQQASLVDIGAVDAVRRTSETADGRARVTQVVGRFPDRTSTWRAHEVLRSWRADCAEELGGRRSDVGALEPVPVRTGHGEAYVAAYRPSDADAPAAAGMRTAGLGIVRKGSWLVVVEVATDARTWPSRWDPTRKAVRRIAATFEG